MSCFSGEMVCDRLIAGSCIPDELRDICDICFVNSLENTYYWFCYGGNHYY